MPCAVVYGTPLRVPPESLQVVAYLRECLENFLLGRSDVEREVRTLPSKVVQRSPRTAGSRQSLVEHLGAFHCEHPTKDVNTREDAYLESEGPRSRADVTAPPELRRVDRVLNRVIDRIPQLPLTNGIQFVDRVPSRSIDRHFRTAVAGVCADGFLCVRFICLLRSNHTTHLTKHG